MEKEEIIKMLNKIDREDVLAYIHLLILDIIFTLGIDYE